MKKLLGIVVLGLLCLSATTYSVTAGTTVEFISDEERIKKCSLETGKSKKICKKDVIGWGLNEYLNHGYKIKSEEMVTIGGGSFTIFILKRKKLTTYFPLVVTCRLNNFSQSIICVEP
ncbi:hypothetical protein OAL81_02615 [Candidatus Pelagibacter sp.]|nr:hypothetical protein [Candidatus Pelagibacter sp.]